MNDHLALALLFATVAVLTAWAVYVTMLARAAEITWRGWRGWRQLIEPERTARG